MQTYPLLIALASVGVTSLGQVALKIGTSKATAASTVAKESMPLLDVVKASLTQPAVLIGLAMYGTGALLWLYVLARWDVSKAYPLVSLGFILTLAVGLIFLDERLSIERILGCALISIGLVFVVRS